MGSLAKHLVYPCSQNLGFKLVGGQLRVEKPPLVTVALKSAAVRFGTKSCPTGGELSDGPEFRQKISSSRPQQHLDPNLKATLNFQTS